LLNLLKIIDTHAHLGVSRFSGVQTTEDEMIEVMDHFEVSAALVMPQPTSENIPDVHQRIYQFSLEHPKRIFGIAAIDPWLDQAAYHEQLKVCMEDYGFVAIKLHPLGHNISPLSPHCQKIYEAAQHYDVPVLVHTGIGNPFSLPSLIIEPAKRFPQITFILSHAGFAVYSDEAIVAAKYCENIILEPSWCQTYMVKKMVEEIGAERMVMGSDHLTNLPVELVKFKSIGLKEDELEQIFYRTANRIFKLNI